VAEATAIIQYAVANGLLGATEGDVYQAPALRQADVMVLILHNIHASNSNDVSLHLYPVGATSRRFLKETLEAGETLCLEKALVMSDGDKIRGSATSANEVSWLTSVKERMSVG